MASERERGATTQRLQRNNLAVVSPWLEDNGAPVPANGRGLQAIVIVQVLEQIREHEGRKFAPVGTLAHPLHCAKYLFFQLYFFPSHFLALCCGG